MVITNRLIACVIFTLLVFLSTVKCRTKYQVCVVDGRGSNKKAARYCPVLDEPDSRVECIIGLDRLDCLRRIAKGKADFAVLTAEDLVTAANLRIEVLVTNELKYNDDKFEYEVVAVINNASGITNRYSLRDKKLCHTGYGYDGEWTRIFANYFEVKIAPQECNPYLTLSENRIKASSKYFKSVCKAGPWVNEPAQDEQLKRKYHNLCELCNSPDVCSANDKYWGRTGPLLCLTDGAGDVTWARLDDVRSHFGLNADIVKANPEGYSFLCPNDTVMSVNSSSPCVWVTKPWPVIATKRTSAQDIQELMSSLSHDEPNSWKSALLNLLETYHVTISTLEPIEAIESYLARAVGFLSANSYPGCHPPRTIRMCTTSNLENAKCGWLREAAAVYGIEPDIECLKADNKTHCLQGIVDKSVDLVMVPPDMLNMVKTKYHMKTLFYETAKDQDKYITVAVVKKDSGIKSMSDLRGKKACFPVYDGVSWNSVVYSLNSKHLLKACPFMKGVADFFGSSCVPDLPKNESAKLQSLCKGNIYNGDYGAMRCLTHEDADVAFVSKKVFRSFFQDAKEKGNIQQSASDYKTLCENNVCHLSWAPLGQGMISTSKNDLWRKDSLDVFLQMDYLFGREYKDLTRTISLYGLYDGKADVLFHDATAKLRDVPIAKNFDRMERQYEEILNNFGECIPSSSIQTLPAANIFVYLICILFLITKF